MQTLFVVVGMWMLASPLIVEPVNSGAGMLLGIGQALGLILIYLSIGVI